MQETVFQTTNEKKIQKMMLVKGKIQKPMARNKKAYIEAAAELTPWEQLHIAAMKYQNESESESEGEDWISDAQIDIVLLEENDRIMEVKQLDAEELPDPAT